MCMGDWIPLLPPSCHAWFRITAGVWISLGHICLFAGCHRPGGKTEKRVRAGWQPLHSQAIYMTARQLHRSRNFQSIITEMLQYQWPTFLRFQDFTKSLSHMSELNGMNLWISYYIWQYLDMSCWFQIYFQINDFFSILNGGLNIFENRNKIC